MVKKIDSSESSIRSWKKKCLDFSIDQQEDGTFQIVEKIVGGYDRTQRDSSLNFYVVSDGKDLCGAIGELTRDWIAGIENNKIQSLASEFRRLAEQQYKDPEGAAAGHAYLKAAKSIEEKFGIESPPDPVIKDGSEDG